MRSTLKIHKYFLKSKKKLKLREEFPLIENLKPILFKSFNIKNWDKTLIYSVYDIIVNISDKLNENINFENLRKYWLY